MSAGTYIKMFGAIGVVGVGMPYMFWKLLPTSEDLKKRYPEDKAPELVKDRERNAVAMNDYIAKIKEYSKDDRNVWIVMKEQEEKARKAYAKQDAHKQRVANEELAARRAEMQREIMGDGAHKS